MINTSILILLIIGFNTFIWKIDKLILNPIQDNTATNFSTVFSTNVEISPQNFLAFSFFSFATMM